MMSKNKQGRAGRDKPAVTEESDIHSDDHSECISVSALKEALDKALEPINREIKSISNTVNSLNAIVGRMSNLLKIQLELLSLV